MLRALVCISRMSSNTVNLTLIKKAVGLDLSGRIPPYDSPRLRGTGALCRKAAFAVRSGRPRKVWLALPESSLPFLAGLLSPGITADGVCQRRGSPHAMLNGGGGAAFLFSSAADCPNTFSPNLRRLGGISSAHGGHETGRVKHHGPTRQLRKPWSAAFDSSALWTSTMVLFT